MIDRFLDDDQDSDVDEDEPVKDSSAADADTSPPMPSQHRYRYDFTQVDTETRQGKELQAVGAGGEVHAGAWVREIFEAACDRPEQATWAGYVDDPVKGVRAVPLEHEALFRHNAVFGTTGYGKTALLINLMVQWAYAGRGFCFLDPKGDGVRALLRRLPERRLDDVIWVEPAPTDHGRVVGLNFLEAGETQSEVELEQEIESILSDLKAILRGEEYWGPTMNAIIENIGRAMIRSDLPYTILDMYFVLADEDRRQAFAETVEDEVVREYTQKIAEMDDETIDPVLKRVQSWVENRITREIVAHRESGVNIKEAVESGKIILVRNTVDSEDMKRMVATGIMRRIWAAIKARESVPEQERTPYFMVVDEFDDVVSEDANVDKMLSKARSMRMSVTLANQQPSQLPEEMQKAIFGNCDNLLALNPNEPEDARVIMKRFGDYTAEDLLNLGRFKLFTRIMVGTERSDPFISHTFPEYPPLRSREEAEEVIERSLDRYGVDRLDPSEITEDLIVGAGDALQQALKDPTDTEEEGSATGPGGRPVQRAVLEAVFVAQIRERKTGDWVPAAAVKEELARRRTRSGSTSQLSSVIEQVPEELVMVERRDGGPVMKLTPEGKTRIFVQDTGRAASGGSDEHRILLRRAFKLFTRAGFRVELPRQAGGEQPDGIAELPIDPASATLDEARRKERRLQERWPLAHELGGGRPLAIEVETTGLTKPMQTLTNLKKAMEASRRCVFAVPDGEHNRGSMVFWAERGVSILTDPPFVRAVDEAGNRTFYNTNERLTIDADVDGREDERVYALREAGGAETRWVEDGSAIVLRDSDGREHVRFESGERLAHPRKADFPAYATYEDGSFVVHADGESAVYRSKAALNSDWIRVPVPFIPERAFPREPTAGDWLFVVFPDDDKEMEPQIYEDGSLRPVSAGVDGEGDDARKDQDPSETTREADELVEGDAGQDGEAVCAHGNDPETCVWCSA